MHGRYDIGSELGRGAFGTVSLAQRRSDGACVAIKVLAERYATWEACKKLREVCSLQSLGGHPCIVSLLEVVREREVLSLVFEYMPTNLHLFIVQEVAHAERGGQWTNPNGAGATSSDHAAAPLIGAARCRDIIAQVLEGLAFLHQRGYFHRDIKPENLLVQRLPRRGSAPALGGGDDGDTLIVKLADFGLAREIRSQPPYTEYVATRWYRAPELLLQAQRYSSPVDVWATACIWAELLALRPLFPGQSQVDMVHRHWCMVGAPNDPAVRWSNGARFAQALGLKLPQSGSGAVAVNAQAMVAGAVRCAAPCDVSLLSSMLALHPQQRWTAQQGLEALRQVDPEVSQLTREVRAVHRELAAESASSKRAEAAEDARAVGSRGSEASSGAASRAAAVAPTTRPDGVIRLRRETLPRDASVGSIDLAAFDALLDDMRSTAPMSTAEAGGRSPRPRSRSRSPRASSSCRPHSPLLVSEEGCVADLESTVRCLSDAQRGALRQGIAKWSAMFAKTSRVPQSMRTLCARYAIPDALALRCLRRPALVGGRTAASSALLAPPASSERPAADDALGGLLDDLDDLFPGDGSDIASK